jgi:hypothetical protein
MSEYRERPTGDRGEVVEDILEGEVLLDQGQRYVEMKSCDD